MSVIWKDYARRCDQQKEKISKRKTFRYPLIIPIIYYEGTDKWTAGMHLSDRISHADLVKDCLPDFTYRIVPLNDYGDQELLDRDNEISLIMRINKIQGADGFHDFRLTALDKLKSIYGRTSAGIQDLILDVLWGLLMKVDVPKEEAADMLKDVKEGKDMGVLFENFEKFDWKEAQKKREEEERKRKEEQRKREEEQRKREEEQRKREEEQRKREEEQRKREEEQRKREAAEEKLKEAEAKLSKAEALIEELQKKLSAQQ